ncbi:ATP-grasp domain-containing protein [Amycolatopsis sp. H20-H5]|uniref:ATP-grasp domain-containing protein n=1 Tax=Amycolatopsis sp. H20-H5 TaxID=3046309 RepID=UPI002DBFB758|nr:hypothetical protein [Amycolatopsis sp. H20-H5]MEC3976650.1 hypothetical protein [Amycolatopsis sp. H20-H5]
MTREAILVACAKMPESNGDEHAVLPALRDLGFAPRWASWDDKTVDFGAAEVVILRATWDYPDRREEFLDWCESVPALCNPAAVARWNTDKTYLSELIDAGVPTVATTLVEPGDDFRWPDKDFVVKPSVGAGSVGVARFTADATGAAAGHLAKLHAEGRTALIQPYQSSVDTEGEIALVFFGGIYSHAFAKGAMLGRSTMDASGMYVSEKLAVAKPSAAFRALAEDALDAAASLLGLLRAELLYARVDVVGGEGGKPLLLELELTEPSLGFRQADEDAPLRFASAVRQQLA